MKRTLIPLLTLLALAYTADSMAIFGLRSAKETKIVCIKTKTGAVPQELDALLRCRAHFDRATSDKYHCYIRFAVDDAKAKKPKIILQQDNQNNILNQQYGQTALATFEVLTKEGITYPQALVFDQSVLGVGKGKFDLETLLKDNASARELVQALGIEVTNDYMKKILLDDSIENFAKLKKMLGDTLPGCAKPKQYPNN